MSPHTDAGALADELKRRFDAYLSSLDGGQNQAVNEVALRNALWDNKAGIIAHLRQAASQGSAGGERSEVQSDLAEHVARAIDAAVTEWQPGSPERIKLKAARAAIEAVQTHGAAQEAVDCGEAERLRKGIQDFLDGNYPGTRRHRPNPCQHGQYWYTGCEQCDEEYLTQLLKGPEVPSADGGAEA